MSYWTYFLLNTKAFHKYIKYLYYLMIYQKDDHWYQDRVHLDIYRLIIIVLYKVVLMIICLINRVMG